MLTTLNTIEILEISKIGFSISILLLPIGGLYLAAAVRNRDVHNMKSILLFVFSIIILQLGFVGALNFAGNDAWKNKTGRFQIEATISDDMPFNSIYDQYEIIEKRGDIYLLEPKVFDLQQEDDDE